MALDRGRSIHEAGFSDRSPMQVKSIFQSKTIAANTIAIAVALFQYYRGPILAADPQWFALAVAVTNLVLRFKTTMPVTL
jgi:hypothetical protein